MRDLLRGLCDLVAPPTCAACDAPIELRAHGFCDACGLLIEPAPHGARDAQQRDACLYGGPIRDALQRLKYEGRSELAPVLAEWLEEPALGWLAHVDCIAVVPLHSRRLHARGYNQSALLARPVARKLGLPFWPSLLRRVRDTDAQVGKSRVERQRQLAQAFVAQPSARDLRVLVIDDVRTTGSTLKEAERALLAAGARAVYSLALACAPEEESG